MNLGEKLKLYRERMNMTQKEVAEYIEVEPATISKYESGMREPNVESLKRLSDLFVVSLDELLKDEEELDISKLNILEILKEQKEMKLKGNLYHNTQIAFTYNSNHIEGSRLTEDQTRFIFETKTILAEQNTVINVDDIIETTNHFKLIDYIIDVAEKKLTENLIKEFHRILKTGTSDSQKEWFNVGDYKALANEAGSIKTVAPKLVEKHMKKLLEWYNSIKQVDIKDIIEFHARFEKIHPFQDGNGRVGRLIMFKECLKHNIVPFIITDEVKLFYYRGISEWHNIKGYLTDTCLSCQDEFKEVSKRFGIPFF